MKVLSLNHYNLRAPREVLDTLRTFYVEVVGLEIGYRPPFTSFGYWLYAGEQAVLHLTESRDSKTPATGATTFDHVAFSCVGRRGFEARFTHLGVPFESARVPQSNQVQLFIQDPTGNGVELNFQDADA